MKKRWKQRRVVAITVLVAASFLIAPVSAPLPAPGQSAYPWTAAARPENALAARIAPPDGFVRVEAAPGSFADWLRHLPLFPGRPPVHLYDGRVKQADVHAAVVDIDVGDSDLQQCADAVIRLRAEYLWQAGRQDEIAFDFTSGDRAEWTRWADGWRPVVVGNFVKWVHYGAQDASRKAFRAYLDKVFSYAGTASLARELPAVTPPGDVRIGDIFIEGGHPGHAVIVVDVARHPESGRTVFLLAQSYMPAQQIHVLKNRRDDALSPWYDTEYGKLLVTPEWAFEPDAHRRFAKP